MNDYYPFLDSLVSKQDNNSPEGRQAAYEIARQGLRVKLQQLRHRIRESEIDAECQAFETAVRRFEVNRSTVPASGTAIASAFKDPALLLREGAKFIKVIDARDVKSASQATVTAKARTLAPAGEDHTLAQKDAPQKTHNDSRQETEEPPAQANLLTPNPAEMSNSGELRQHFSLVGQGTVVSDAPYPSGRLRRRLGPLYIVFGIAELLAFLKGLATWFGLDLITRLAIFAALFLTGSVGTIPIGIVAFYGAWRGWQWPIWLAAPFASVFVILSFAYLGLYGIYTLGRQNK